jgi:hypothetical protein
MQARKVLECAKQSLLGDSGGNSEDYFADRDVESENHAPELSDGSEGSIGNWTKGRMCYILAKNLSMFCPCPKTLCEAEFKGNRLKLGADGSHL